MSDTNGSRARRREKNQDARARQTSRAHAKFEVFRYPGTQHGFNNDTTPRYDGAAAKLAWQRTLAFFNEKLRAPARAGSARKP